MKLTSECPSKRPKKRIFLHFEFCPCVLEIVVTCFGFILVAKIRMHVLLKRFPVPDLIKTSGGK